MRKVELYGTLGEEFGKEFYLNVKTIRQALRLLAANFKNFNQHLIDSKGVVGYEVWDGDFDIEGVENDFVKEGEGTIRIVPRISGAGANARIIAGVVLVIIGIIMMYTPAAAGGPSVIGLGLSLIAGGIAEKLAGKPKVPDQTQTENTKSYLFSGAVNTTRQGVPVQIGYGKMLIGSAVISASITTVDTPI